MEFQQYLRASFSQSLYELLKIATGVFSFCIFPPHFILSLVTDSDTQQLWDLENSLAWFVLSRESYLILSEIIGSSTAVLSTLTRSSSPWQMPGMEPGTPSMQNWYSTTELQPFPCDLCLNDQVCHCTGKLVLLHSCCTTSTQAMVCLRAMSKPRLMVCYLPTHKQ